MKLTIEGQFFTNGSCYYSVRNEDGELQTDGNAAIVTNWRRVLELVLLLPKEKSWLDKYQTPEGELT